MPYLTFYLALILCISLTSAHLRAATFDVGATPASFDVDLQGATNYSISIKTPPGSAGMSPQIDLRYSSQAGPSPMGMGWGIGGISAITRGSKNISTDKVATGVTFTNQDALYLDGQRLIPTKYINKSTIEYRTYIDNYSRITEYRNPKNNSKHFIVETKAGLVLEFGITKNSRSILQNGETLLWLNNRVIDSSSNYIDYNYEQSGYGTYVLKSANYTGNLNAKLMPFAKIEFEYCDVDIDCKNIGVENTIAPSIHYTNGEKIIQNKLLTKIKSFYLDRTHREYKFKHQLTNRHSRHILKSIQEFSGDGNGFPPTSFSYTNDETNWSNEEDYIPIPSFSYDNIHRPNSYLISDINNDNLLDVLHSEDHIYEYNETRFGSEKGLVPDKKFSLPIPISESQNGNNGLELIDVNGDRRLDLVWNTTFKSGKNIRGAAVNTVNGWVMDNTYTPPLELKHSGARRTEIIVHDVNQDGQSDYVVNSQQLGIHAFLYDQATGWVDSSDHYAPFDTQENMIQKIDIDQDGIDEFLIVNGDNNGINWVRLYNVDKIGWKEIKDASLIPPVPSNIPISAIHFMDINNDLKSDFLYSYEEAGNLTSAVFNFDGTKWVKNIDLSNIPYALGSREESLYPSLVDVNGDLLTDIVVFHEDKAGKETKFTLLNNSLNWISDSNFIPKGTLSSSLAGKNRVYFGDINEDELNDILYLDGTGKSSIELRTYTNSGSGWISNISLAPPDPIAKEGEHSLGVKFSDLDGDGLVDMLFSRIDNSNNDPKSNVKKNAWRNTGGGWIKFKEYSDVPYPIFSSKFGDTGAQLLDISGDGLADFIYSVKKENGDIVAGAYVNTGKGWIKNKNYTAVLEKHYLFEENKGNIGAKFLDLNGDGLTDIIYRVRLNDKEILSNALINNGKSWVENPNFISPVDFSAIFVDDINNHYNDSVYYYRDLSVSLSDINGDRLPDILFNHETKNNKYKTPITRTIDGRTIYIYADAAAKQYKGAYINTGNGWTSEKDYIFNRRLDERFVDENSTTLVLDINGDGLQDILYANNKDAKIPSSTFINTGKGWIDDKSYKIPNQVIGNLKNQLGFRILDLNADGLIDLLYSRCLKQDSASNKKCITTEKGVYINNGSTWIEDKNITVPPIQINIIEKGDQGVRIFDINGDGLADILQHHVDENNVKTTNAYLNTNYRVDLLNKISDGLSQEVQLTYEPIGKSSIGKNCVNDLSILYCQTKRLPYPLLTAVPAIYVVSRAEYLDPGVDQLKIKKIKNYTHYSYGNFRVDVRKGVPLGFEWQKTKSSLSDLTVKTSIQHDQITSGLINNSSTTYKGILLNQENNVWNIVERSGAKNPLGGNYKYHQLVLQSKIIASNDIDGSQLKKEQQNFKYDRFGNVIVSSQTLNNGPTTTSKNVYKDNVSSWHLGRLIKNTVVQSNKFESVSRQACFDYDSKTGLITSETLFCEDMLALEKKYKRDVFGNITTTTSTAIADPKTIPRTHTTSFDSFGRFPVKEYNSLGHTITKKYEDFHGNLIELRDTNGLTTRYEYDSHGTVLKETHPTGITKRSKIYHLPVNSRNAYYASEVTLVGSNSSLPPLTTWYDRTGKELRKIQIGFDGNEVIEEYVYDQLGRVIAYYMPQNTTSPVSKTTLEYDSLDRVIKIIAPNNSSLKYEYSGKTTFATDQLGRITSTQYDYKNNPLVAIDQNGEKLTYAYDVIGRLSRSTNVDGAVTEHKYDLAGNEILTKDPDMGIWKYEYNSFGELISQTNAENRITSMIYDQIGRMTFKKTQEQGMSWRYDENSINGIPLVGLLTSTDDGLGHTEKYEHDIYGRLVKVHSVINNEIFTSKISYDEFGRIVDRIYPKGFSTKNIYNDNGYFTKVVDPNDTQTYWEALDIDALGRILSEKTGNGLIKKRSYEPSTGFLNRESIENTENTKLQDLSYRYDLMGNQTGRNNLVSKENTNYTYDSLDRLVKTISTAGFSQSLKYDKVGNIQSKSDYGEYHYGQGNTPVNGVAEVTRLDGTIQKYIYDKNGNLISGPKGIFTYNTANLPIKISSSKRIFSEFKYDNNGEKYFHRYQDGKKYLESSYTGLYEKSYEAMVPPFNGSGEHFRHRNYIVGGNGVVGVFEQIEYLFPVRHSSRYHRSTTSVKPERTVVNGSYFRYLSKDNSESITLVSDEKGNVIHEFEYDSWGNRRNVDKKNSYFEYKFGFTGHDHLDHLNLIHAGGRVYDPELARFTSADPIIQAPDNPQSHNRYSYVLNNPNKYIDPTGYGWDPINDIKKGLKNIGNAIAKPFRKLGKWVEKNWKQIVVVVVVVVVTYVSLGTLTPVVGPAAAGILGGMIAGAAGGATGAWLYGGNVLEGALVGAVIGGVTAGFAMGGAEIAGAWGKAIGTGLVQGSIALGRGGNFFKAFASAAAAAYFHAKDYSAGFGKVVSGAIIGGTASVIGGGKFANGAAFSAIRSFTVYTITNFTLSANAINRAYRYITSKAGLSDLYGKLKALPLTIVGMASGVVMHPFGLLFSSNASISFGHNAMQFTGLQIGAKGSAVTLGNSILYETNTGPSDTGAYGNPYVVVGFHEEEHTYQWQQHGLSLLWHNGGILKDFGTLNNHYEMEAQVMGFFRKYAPIIEQR